MDILFSNRKLERLCCESREATRKLGADAARKLRTRLDDMRDSGTLAFLKYLPGRCEELTGDRAGQLSLRITKGLRLVFQPADNPVPEKPDGGLDWTKVQMVNILAVEDYHG